MYYSIYCTYTHTDIGDPAFRIICLVVRNVQIVLSRFHLATQDLIITSWRNNRSLSTGGLCIAVVSIAGLTVVTLDGDILFQIIVFNLDNC